MNNNKEFQWTDELVKEFADNHIKGWVLKNTERELSEFKKSKEVKPDYVILSFLNKSQNIVLSKRENGRFKSVQREVGVSEEMLLALPHMSLHSIKRYFDNEVFTIGDMGMISCIESFVINDNQMYVKEVLVAWSPLNILKKIKPILFTTEDGVDIFHCDYYYLLNTLNWTYTKNNTINTYYPNEYPFLNFSSEGIAKEYIFTNKPILVSYNELVPFLEQGSSILRNKTITDFFKSKVNL